MQRDKIIQLLIQHKIFNNKINLTRNAAHKISPEILDSIIQYTSFLPNNTDIKERLFCIKFNITSVSKCECGKSVPLHTSPAVMIRYQTPYKQFCSRDCLNKSTKRVEKQHSTMVKKYGVKHAFQSDTLHAKAKNTWLKKYGVNNPNKNDKIKQKIADTNLKKYGNVCSIYGETQLEQRNNTWFNKYNVVNPLSSEEVKQKAKITKQKKYGDPYFTNSVKSQETHEAKYNRIRTSQLHITDNALASLNDKAWLLDQHHLSKLTLKEIGQLLGVNETTVGNYCRKHGIEIKYFFQSVGEKQIGNFLKEIDVDFLENDRNVISPLELDIIIPSHNIAIEYCGLYWHSEQQGKDKNYHKQKYDLCKQKNIQLLTIYEDEWLNRQEQVKSKIKSLLNIDDRQSVYARNTIIIPVSQNHKKEFFEDYHLQGNGPSSINIGLQYNKELVACMGFVKQNDVYVLNRYATSYRVIGGFSKLLKFFQDNYHWSEIVSFADLRWSTGNLYTKTGWKLDKILPPDYYYSPDGHQRIHKFNYRRKNLPKLLETFDPEISERENCDINGIFRIWDCGKLRFTMQKSKD